jgi:hypothetical protein
MFVSGEQGVVVSLLDVREEKTASDHGARYPQTTHFAARHPADSLQAALGQPDRAVRMGASL